MYFILNKLYIFEKIKIFRKCVFICENVHYKIASIFLRKIDLKIRVLNIVVVRSLIF